MGDTIQIYSGVLFDPANPNLADIHITDIAHALARIARFTGHTEGAPLSVAQHSLLVSKYCSPENALWGLLHDGSEYACVDLPSPIKRKPELAGYRAIEKTMALAICRKFGLPEEEPAEVRLMDRRALVTEALSLLKPGVYDWRSLAEPFPEEVVPLGYAEAEKAFLERFYALSSR